MKTFIKAIVITTLLVGCKKSVDQQKPLPKNYQTALMRVQSVDNDGSVTTSQLVAVKIEK